MGRFYAKGTMKTEKLKFNGFTPAAYLLSKNLTVHEVKTLFKLRTRMINVKANFSSNQDNLWCKACLLFKETQEHLIECPSIRIRVRHLIKFSDFDINMIFGTLGQQEKFAKMFHIVLQARDEILTPLSTGDQSTSSIVLL